MLKPQETASLEKTSTQIHLSSSELSQTHRALSDALRHEAAKRIQVQESKPVPVSSEGRSHAGR